jgi:hypothetical protein
MIEFFTSALLCNPEVGSFSIHFKNNTFYTECSNPLLCLGSEDCPITITPENKHGYLALFIQRLVEVYAQRELRE